jgi:uncharacterized protein DUF1553/uncharacterized protein DUF1549
MYNSGVGIRHFAPACVLLPAMIVLAAEAVAPLPTYTETERKAWSLQKRTNPAVPTFTSATAKAWAKSPVDAFILDKLQKAGLKPSPPASRTMLVRRLYFDLTGLPPTPAEVTAFVNDKSPHAYAKLIDKLLASPNYGERWGQHWLDVVRYAETDGYEYDTHRGDAWRYRDYVIRAFNNDKPFDRFIQEQVAGDEIAPQEEETLIASGFNRLGPVRKNAGNQEVASSRNEILTEMTNVIGAAFLGMTVGCARCHDHKFDPIRQSDYYRLQAFFSETFENDVQKATPEEQAAWKEKAAPVEAEIRKLRGQMAGLRGKKDAETADKREALMKQIEEWQEKLPAPLPSIHSVANKPDKKTPIHILMRGDYTKKGDAVGMRVPGVLLPPGAPELPPDTKNPRQQMAKWLTDPDHPLVSRVMVNRIWTHHFGRGIIETPNDFGRMGGRPTHPELLDYLANQFVANGWSVKSIHRLILNSNTYQQSSADVTDPALKAAIEEKDSENKLLWRFNRRRLEAEEIRDAILAVSGSLNLKAGGPSVMVPIDKGLVNTLYKPSQWAPPKDPLEYNRRGVYLIVKRNLALPFMQVFDAPDGSVSCPRRESSTHAPQALELLNGDLTNQHADALAARLEKEAGPDLQKQIDLGYRLVTGRPARPKEIQLAINFLKTEPKRQFAMILLNLNSFLYVN